MNESPEETPILDLAKVRPILEEIAKQAASRALIYQRDPEERVEKHMPVNDDGGMATSADYKLNQYIIDQLRSHFSDHAFKSEEIPWEGSDEEYTWIIDPLDGTSEWSKGLDEYAISIGLVREGKPVFGVVAVPARDLIVSAYKNGGIFLNGESCSPPEGKPEMDKETRIAISSSEKRKYTDFRKLLDLLPGKKEDMGSTTLKALLVALGEFDGYLTRTVAKDSEAGEKGRYTKEWDICAADIILSEAGRVLTDLGGKEFRYNKEDPRNHNGILAATTEIHRQMLSIINT